jgi:phosphoribosylformylglycinamidine synthase subunit PurQ / glutaminase
VRFGVITFPGSNGDHDALSAIELGLKQDVAPVWHKDRSVDGFDVLIVPGGFSYGDYLRAGAIARFSPIMDAVVDFANQGGPVLGICNGFQVLAEAGLVPGSLLRNANLAFSCRWVNVRVETSRTPFSSGLAEGDVLHLPIAHGEGRYFVTPEELARLEASNQIVFRYSNAAGELDPASNPNGSTDSIAGVCNSAGNVVALMPHPERAYDRMLGGDEGLRILGSVLEHANNLAVAR